MNYKEEDHYNDGLIMGIIFKHTIKDYIRRENKLEIEHVGKIYLNPIGDNPYYRHILIEDKKKDSFITVIIFQTWDEEKRTFITRHSDLKTWDKKDIDTSALKSFDLPYCGF